VCVCVCVHRSGVELMCVGCGGGYREGQSCEPSDMNSTDKMEPSDMNSTDQDVLKPELIYIYIYRFVCMCIYVCVCVCACVCVTPVRVTQC
jgi:hypothetical protein